MVYLFCYILLLGTKGDDGGAAICDREKKKATLTEPSISDVLLFLWISPEIGVKSKFFAYTKF
jgi:hypothetical protein